MQRFLCVSWFVCGFSDQVWRWGEAGRWSPSTQTTSPSCVSSDEFFRIFLLICRKWLNFRGFPLCLLIKILCVVELDKPCYCNLKVVNNSEHHVAFKVRGISIFAFALVKPGDEAWSEFVPLFFFRSRRHLRGSISSGRMPASSSRGILAP